MNMDLYFQVEFIKVVFAYLILYIGLPLIAWKKVLQDKGYLYRFLFCILTQTFFVINLTLSLGLLHILNKVTFVLGMFVYIFVVRFRGEYRSVYNSFLLVLKDIKFLIFGEYGISLFRKKYLQKITHQIKTTCNHLFQHFKLNFIEYLFLIGICLYTLWKFSYMPLQTHTYTTSDIPVHHYWIYEMAHGNIFVKGIYPYGMHCMIYAIYAMFGISLKSVLLFFGTMQSLITTLMLYALMKTLCKGKFSPIMATLFFTISPDLYGGMFQRMMAALPQETGFYALYPIIIFACRFLNQDLERKRGGYTSKIRNVFSCKQYFTKEYFNWDICLFSIAIALTFSIHSYVTMIAFFLCIGIGIVYLFRLLKKQYFIPIFVGGICGILIASAPMAVAFAEGIKFQGSISWAQSVINESISSNNEAKESETSDSTDKIIGTVDPDGTVHIEIVEKKVTLLDKFENACFPLKNSRMTKEYVDYTVFSFMILCVMALMMLVFKKTRKQAMGWLALAIYFSIVFVYTNPRAFGIIELIQSERVLSFFTYMVPVILFLPFDFPFILIDLLSKRVLIMIGTICSYVYCAMFAIVSFKDNHIRKLEWQVFTQSKDASDCIELIIQQDEDWQWTVLSTTAEIYQTVEHGFHYEITDYIFKKNVKHEKDPIYIPTPHIYIFIEKNTMDYKAMSSPGGFSFKEYMDNLKPIDNAYAYEKLYASFNPSTIYMSKRIQLFSRMNLMVQKLKQMYPQDVSVFYETENFICYKVEQNPYYLFNLNFEYLEENGGVANEAN